MAKRSLSGLIARKTLGTIVLWGTVGVASVQALFYITFGAAV